MSSDETPSDYSGISEDLETGYGEIEDSLEELLEGEPEQEDLEQVYENLGLDIVSGLYGLSRREEQFDELYKSFKDYKKAKSIFREGHRRKEQAYDDLIDSFENYFGDVSEETETNAKFSGAFMRFATGSIGNVTKEDLREVLVDIKENVE